MVLGDAEYMERFTNWLEGKGLDIESAKDWQDMKMRLERMNYMPAPPHPKGEFPTQNQLAKILDFYNIERPFITDSEVDEQLYRERQVDLHPRKYQISGFSQKSSKLYESKIVHLIPKTLPEGDYEVLFVDIYSRKNNLYRKKMMRDARTGKILGWR